MKQININGTIFEIKKSIKKLPYYRGTKLEDCYDKPSYKKSRIYWDWWNWFCEFDYNNRIGDITINSYNTFMFTLTMAVRYNDNIYHLYITPSHNYAYPIIESEVK